MYVIEETGMYKVKFGDPCSSTSDALLAAFTSLASETRDEIKVFPNPFADYLAIEGLTEFNKVYFYDITGRLIHLTNQESDLAQLELNFLPAGPYFVKIKTQSGNYWQKVIKK